MWRRTPRCRTSGERGSLHPRKLDKARGTGADRPVRSRARYGLHCRAGRGLVARPCARLSREVSNEPSSARAAACSLWDMVRYMTKLGTIGFGGPVALVGYMHRDLVEERRWISEADYKEGLTLSQLMPGPLAAQLAIYLGYVHYGITGATLAGVAFVLPSFVMVVALGAAYVAYGGLTWMQAVFYGVGAAVIGIIALSAYKLTTKSIGADKLLWVIYAAAVAVTVVTESESVWVFLIAGLLMWLAKAPPPRAQKARRPTRAGPFPAG